MRAEMTRARAGSALRARASRRAAIRLNIKTFCSKQCVTLTDHHIPRQHAMFSENICFQVASRLEKLGLKKHMPGQTAPTGAAPLPKEPSAPSRGQGLTSKVQGTASALQTGVSELKKRAYKAVLSHLQQAPTYALVSAATIGFLYVSDEAVKALGRNPLRTAEPMAGLVASVVPVILLQPTYMMTLQTFIFLVSNRYGTELALSEVLSFAFSAFVCGLSVTFAMHSGSLNAASGVAFLCAANTGAIVCGLVYLAMARVSKEGYSADNAAVQWLFIYFTKIIIGLRVFLSRPLQNVDVAGLPRFFAGEALRSLPKTIVPGLRAFVLTQIRRRTGVPQQALMYADAAESCCRAFEYLAKKVGQKVDLERGGSFSSSLVKVWTSMHDYTLPPSRSRSVFSDKKDV